ncbi:MAG: DUF3048 domain-containing protein [Lachnospiraceae bacterium]|nr:DUF3048 domain-containing protein [Lachnospiraceae bacterium]
MKKRTLLLTLSLTVAIAMVGCGKKEAATEEPATVETVDPFGQQGEEATTEAAEEVTDEIPEGMVRSDLTNELIDASIEKQRPIAAMVDNELTALPHYGLAEADVVYEMMNSTKNGRITRLMVLVKDWEKIEQLGSIRSVRPTNILLAAEWNAVLCHDGGPFYIDPYLANDYAAHFSGTFSRVNNGKAREYTEYIVKGDLDKNFKNSKYSTEYDEFYTGPHYKFASPSSPVDLSKNSDSKDATKIELPFEHNKSNLQYNADTQTYDYYEYGKAHKDGEDDEVLTFKNVLLQSCSFHQYDENGYMIYNCLAADQEGYYITDGKAIPVTWTKLGETAVTQYFDADGNEITINTGKTYVALVPDDTWDDVVIE